jgi:hypothetical protein
MIFPLNFLQAKEFYLFFCAFILLFGSMTGLTADIYVCIFREMLYNVLHRKLRKTF